ncbi:MAG: hypothetical protein Q8S45_00580 [Lutibacter sp.]|nr:hypothetical protein [Lutibacter sp.]MDP3311831.1 hypothetical protein [Lutibacter sp.]
MSKSVIITFLLIFYTTLNFGQQQLNNYKYILVPKRFEFQKLDDQYQLNSLTKFLFNKAGYTVFFSDDSLPQEVANNGCLALKTLIVDNSSMFTTKVKIDLLDCYNTIVLSTAEGSSKEKDYKKGYQEAIRNAFTELENLNYKYNTAANVTSMGVVKKEMKEVIVTPNVEIKEVEEVQIKKEPKIKIMSKPIEEPIEVLAVKPSENGLVGNYDFGNYGVGTIKKNESEYIVVVGDEHLEIAQIFTTSKPKIFIIKWAAFKQPKLVELDVEGNLRVDQNNGNVTVYKRKN